MRRADPWGESIREEPSDADESAVLVSMREKLGRCETRYKVLIRSFGFDKKVNLGGRAVEQASDELLKPVFDSYRPRS